MVPAEIEKKVIDIVSDKLGMDRNAVKPSSCFADDLAADSLDRIEVIMGVEDEFDIQVPDTDVDEIKSVLDLVDYISERI